MRTWVSLILGVVLISSAACAPKTVVVPEVSSPRFPEFLEPSIPAHMAGSPAAVSHERAWRFLQAGDFRNADREVAAALKTAGAFYPSQALAGYIELARKDHRAAIAAFDRALASEGRYVPALAGRGEALVALNRDAEAIDAFQAALALDPSLADIERRLEVLRLRIVQRDVAAARQAARDGRVPEALRAYRHVIAISPDSSFLYRELAVLERDHGETDAALEHYRKAIALDPADVASFVEMGELLEARGEVDAALEAYGDALALNPDSSVTAKRDALRARAELARLPAEYRAIESASQVTRADLAALIGIRLAPLLQTTRSRNIGVMTDTRGHWAERWMLAVARAGVMEPYANHTFQPRNLTRRVDFAQVVTRLLSKVASVAPAEARRWRNARGRFPDISASHVAYPAASTATAAGVMTTAPDGSFQPTRPVTGAEAVEALDRVARMANLSPFPGPVQ